MRYYGYRVSLPDRRDWVYKVTGRILPPSVDLRRFCPSIYNQGELGSCTANAIAAALDFERYKQGEEFINPSRLFIYYNERRDDGTVSSDAGATIRESVKVVVKYGACPESEWPYDIQKFTEPPPGRCYADAIKYEVLTYERVPPKGIKEVLATGRPVVAGISVYESFPESSKTGEVPLPKKHEKLKGGHAILIVGYEEDKFIFRNSWGEGWGESGYGTLPQKYVLNPHLASDMWALLKVK